MEYKVLAAVAILVSCDRADGYLGGPFWIYERVDK